MSNNGNNNISHACCVSSIKSCIYRHITLLADHYGIALYGYTVSGVAILVKNYANFKLNCFIGVVKKSNSATGSSNFCSLCNCSIDLAVYNYTACTVIVHTGDISRSVNDSTVGYTVKVKLEYTLRRVGVSVIESYACAGGKYDSGLLVCFGEVGVLNSKVTGSCHTLGVHLDTTDVSECTTVYKNISVAVCPHTVSVVRTVEGTAIECNLAAGCESTVNKGTISISNLGNVEDTECKVHEACVSNITACNLAKLKVLKCNLLAGCSDVTLNVKIDLCVLGLTYEANGIVAAGESNVKSNLIKNFNYNIATHSLCSLESFCKCCITNAVYRSSCVYHAPNTVFVLNRVLRRNITGDNFAVKSRICDGNLNGPLGRAGCYEEVDVAIDHSVFTNGKLTGVSVLAGILHPDGLVSALDCTAVNGQNVLRLSAVKELTNRTVGRLDSTAVDNGLSVCALAIGKVVNAVCHVGATEMLDSTVLNNELTANSVGDYGRVSVPTTIVGCSKSDLTVTGNSEFTLVSDKCEATGRVICTGDSLAVKVKSYLISISNACIQSNICTESDCITVLCCCKCLCKSCIVGIADLCYCLNNAVGVVSILAYCISAYKVVGRINSEATALNGYTGLFRLNSSGIRTSLDINATRVNIDYGRCVVCTAVEVYVSAIYKDCSILSVNSHAEPNHCTVGLHIECNVNIGCIYSNLLCRVVNPCTNGVIKNNSIKKLDGVTGLCCLICILKGCIVGFADLGNRSNNCVNVTVVYYQQVGIVSCANLISCAGYVCNSYFRNGRCTTKRTCYDTNTSVGANKCNILNSCAVKSLICDDTGDTTNVLSTGDCKTGSAEVGVVRGKTAVHLNVGNYATDYLCTGDVGTCITGNGKVACVYATSGVCKYTCGVVATIDCDVATNCDIAYSCVVRICDCSSNDVTVSINGNVLNYKISNEVLITSCPLGYAEEACVCIAVRINCGIGDGEILNLESVTIEVTHEAMILVCRTDSYPVLACKVNVCCKVNCNALIVVCTAIYCITECLKVFYIINIMSLGIVNNGSISVFISLAEDETLCNKRNVSSCNSCSIELAATDCTCKLSCIGATDLTIECTIGYCELNVISRIGYEYGGCIVAVGLECTAVNSKLRAIVYCLYPNLTVEGTAVDGHFALPETDGTVVRSRNSAAVDGSRTGVLEDCTDHMSSECLRTLVLDCTVLNYESTLVADGVRAPTKVRIACTCISEGNLTVICNSKITLVENHLIGLGASLRLAKSLAVEVESDSHACGNYESIFKSYVLSQAKSYTVLQCCLKSFSKGVVSDQACISNHRIFRGAVTVATEEEISYCFVLEGYGLHCSTTCEGRACVSPAYICLRVEVVEVVNVLTAPALSYICGDVSGLKLSGAAECPVVNMNILTVAGEGNLGDESLLECTVCDAETLGATCREGKLRDRSLVECLLTEVGNGRRNYNLAGEVGELACEGANLGNALFDDKLLNSVHIIGSAADSGSRSVTLVNNGFSPLTYLVGSLCGSVLISNRSTCCGSDYKSAVLIKRPVNTAPSTILVSLDREYAVFVFNRIVASIEVLTGINGKCTACDGELSNLNIGEETVKLAFVDSNIDHSLRTCVDNVSTVILVTGQLTTVNIYGCSALIKVDSNLLGINGTTVDFDSIVALTCLNTLVRRDDRAAVKNELTTLCNKDRTAILIVSYKCAGTNDLSCLRLGRIYNSQHACNLKSSRLIVVVIADCEAIQIKSDVVSNSNGCSQSNVINKSNSFACLCSCDCVCKSLVTYLVYNSLTLDNTKGAVLVNRRSEATLEFKLAVSRIVLKGTARDQNDLLLVAVLLVNVTVFVTAGGDSMLEVTIFNVKTSRNFCIRVTCIEHCISLIGDKVTTLDSTSTRAGYPNETGAILALNLGLTIDCTRLILATVKDSKRTLVIDCEGCKTCLSATLIIEDNSMTVKINSYILSINYNTVVSEHALISCDGEVTKKLDCSSITRLDEIKCIVNRCEVDILIIGSTVFSNTIYNYLSLECYVCAIAVLNNISLGNISSTNANGFRNGNLNGPLGRVCGYEKVNTSIDRSISFNGKLTAICLSAGIVEEDSCATSASNSTAVDGQNVICLSAVKELTNCTVGRNDVTAVDYGLSICALAIGKVINSISHIGATEMLDSTVHYSELATRVVSNNNGGCIPITVFGSHKSDCTVTGNGELTNVINKIEVTGSIVILTGNGLAIKVKSYLLSILDSSIKLDIRKKGDGCTVLCSFECICKRGVLNAINRSHLGNNYSDAIFAGLTVSIQLNTLGESNRLTGVVLQQGNCVAEFCNFNSIFYCSADLYSVFSLNLYTCVNFYSRSSRKPRSSLIIHAVGSKLVNSLYLNIVCYTI